MTRGSRQAALVLSSLLLSWTAQAREPAVRPGKDVYDRWCSACHDDGPGHPGTQALLSKYKGERPGALLKRTDLDGAVIAYFVRHGISIMPPFRKTEIDDRELRDLSKYMLTRDRH